MTVSDRLGAEAHSAPEPPQSFEALFLTHWPRVYAVLMRLLGDHAEAEDLALEAFWRLHQRPAQDRGRGNLGGWLYRVALNLGYNALRGARRRERHELAAGQEALTQNAPPPPEDQVIQHEARLRVREALSALPPRDAQLLVLRHSGLTYKEIAAALHLAPASVGTLLARAEAAFAARYAQLEGPAA